MMMAELVRVRVPVSVGVGVVVDRTVGMLGDVAVEVDVRMLAAAMLVHDDRDARQDGGGKEQQEEDAETAPLPPLVPHG